MRSERMDELKDLFVRYEKPAEEVFGSQAGGSVSTTRPATVSDLVEALQAEGFLVVRPEALREILNEELAELVEALGEDADNA